MHVEPAKMPMETMKDLAKHYVMIVLGIVTALALEAWVEHVHERHAAEAASTQIEAEIRTNRSEIDKARARDTQRMHDLQKLRDVLVQDIKAHASDAQIIQHMQQNAPDGLYLDWRWPILRHEAWDVAVANQSAGWIDNDKLRRYAAVYAAQNARSTLMSEDLPIVLDGPRMVDVIIDLQVGNVQPTELLHVVNQMVWLTNEASHNLEGLAATIDAAMSDQPTNTTSAATTR
ncbi:MAG TPA: hypothetical protein VME63_04350 [Dyella sp.]|uniref:hypothetical protein n=1 Tax=Dyella sp. TaxID=1869338 RepID=UPI002B95D5BF|nr:hypothetical protein [Dyella sp.]HTV84610.1 hypothetical protein [Dyella sp.]